MSYLPSGDNIISFVGSNTLGEKLIPLLAMHFMEDELKAKNVEQHTAPSDSDIIYITGDIEGKKNYISVVAKGSGLAFDKNYDTSLISNHPFSIGMASRKIKNNEINFMKDKYRGWDIVNGPSRGEGTEHIIAMDGIAIIVHPSNPIKSLTIDTLRKIYSMEITDWSQVNKDTAHGKVGKIDVFSRAKPSGSRDFFIEKIQPSEKINDATQLISSSELAEKVSTDSNAIGFVSESYIDSGKVKAIDISQTDQLEGALPCDRDLIRDETYYLSRPLFLYTPTNNNQGTIRKFLQYTLRDDIQDKLINQQARLISITGTKHEIIENKVSPAPLLKNNQNVILRIYGSDTIGENLAPKLAMRFFNEKSAVNISEEINFEHTSEGDAPVIRVNGTIDGNKKTIEIKHRKSSFGFESLSNCTCDIAMSSDEISPKYKDIFDKKGIINMDSHHAQYAIGIDAIAVIVNDSNPLRSLSLSQIRSIFSGKIVNWNELGGSNQPITVYSRPEGSGTRQFFTKQALNEAEITPRAIIKLRNSEISSAVSNDSGGIAYLPRTESDNSTIIGIGEGSDRYEPTPYTVVKRDLYPIGRKLYLYIPPSDKNITESQRNNYPYAKEFTRMAITLNSGQKDVENSRFFPIIIIPDDKEKYKTEPLTSVYFDFNSSMLDSNSENKINTTMQEHSEWQNKHFIVKGYSDIIGSDQACKTKASQRAQIVSDRLRQKGFIVDEAISGGKSNLNGHTKLADKSLLKEDRRAEIWIKTK